MTSLKDEVQTSGHKPEFSAHRELCTHAPARAGCWEAWLLHTRFAFQSLVHMLEADKKMMGSHANSPTDISATGLFRMRCAEPYAQFILFRGAVRERANILDKQGNMKKKRRYYYFEGNINPSSFLQFLFIMFYHRPLS